MEDGRDRERTAKARRLVVRSAIFGYNIWTLTTHQISKEKPASAEEKAQSLWALGQERRQRGDIVQKLETGDALTDDQAALHEALVSPVDATLRDVALSVAQAAFMNLRDGVATPEETEQMIKDIIETVTEG